MDKGNRFAVLVAALGIAGTAFCLSLVGPGQTAPVGVDLAAVQGEAAPAAQKTTQQTTTSVEIMGYAYQPAALTINAGDTVTWTNHDTAPHNVVVTNGPEKFTSPTLQQGQSYSYTFTKPGSYSYYCSIHPDMKASVTVNGSTTPPTTTPPSTTTPPTTTPPTSHPTTHPSPTTTAPPTGTCIKKETLAPFIAHLKAAHLETSPLQQVQDALAFDKYIKAHTVLLEQMLDPALNSSLDRDALAPFIAHLKAAHLETSPLQQVQDALAFDNYIKAHTVLFEQMLDPAFNQAIC